MNKFFNPEFDLQLPYKTDSEKYNYIVDQINEFKKFQIDDLYRSVNRELPKGNKLERSKLVDVLRVLIKSKLLRYDLDNQLIILTQIKKQ